MAFLSASSSGVREVINLEREAHGAPVRVAPEIRGQAFVPFQGHPASTAPLSAVRGRGFVPFVSFCKCSSPATPSCSARLSLYP